MCLAPQVVLGHQSGLHPQMGGAHYRHHKGFHWPDVRELRSKYSCLEGARLTPGSGKQDSGRGMVGQVQKGGSLDQKLSELMSDGYYVSAGVPLSKQHTLTVLEKHPTTPSMFCDHVSHLSVTERLQVYQFTQEPDLQTDTGFERVRKPDTQQGVVRNLQEKFLTLG